MTDSNTSSSSKFAQSDLLKIGGSGANVVNLILIATIGWNARDVMNETLDKLEDTAIAVNELKASNANIKIEIDKLKGLAEMNQATRDDLNKFKEEMRKEVEKLKDCVRSRRIKCDV